MKYMGAYISIQTDTFVCWFRNEEYEELDWRNTYKFKHCVAIEQFISEDYIFKKVNNTSPHEWRQM